ncbi:Zinc finger SWIM domain-containing protein 8 [Mizuhopecten yessoensis]|uniref:Zinc finger SWIM domain-containing protein 8 n=2 Tax=Mizuhopecten yessoensis TaxID=6573 RepID=A0A210R061_MIZYE|nr:Zinc finger SWIM domain-containing protein 8 [Mizuhopecten yessoensis]
MDALDGIIRIWARGSRNLFDDDSDSNSYADSMDSLNSLFDDHQYLYSSRTEVRRPKTPEIVKEKPKTVLRLMDLAAKVTAQHYSCESIETHNPPLDEALLKKVSFWAFPQDEKKVKIYARISLKSEDEWRRGEIFYGEKRIQDIRQVGFMVSAIINKQISKVSVTFEKQQITSSTCAMCPQAIWCPHIIAVILHRIRHTDTISVHAPVTETLSTLTRDQLQKLLQYAINEDPAGILGRVFQHIDALRDATSDMNSLQGAPDPTFGVSIDDKLTWSLSLDLLKKNLMEDLRLGYKSYPDSCNIVEKMKSIFFDQYFQRVMELMEKEEPAAAREVLVTIAESVLDVINNQRSPSNMLKRILCDCERLFSCFIVACPDDMKHEIVAKASILNARARRLTSQIEFTKPSLWADMSSIKLPSEKQDGVIGLAFEGYPFYQAVCASLIPSPSQSLQELLCCRYSTTTSSYEEPLPVMLIRLDCFMSLEPTVSGDKVQKLGIMILKKLLVLSLKLSILGSKESTVDLEAVVKDDGPSEDGPTRAKRRKPSARRGKAKKKTTAVPHKAAGTSATTRECCDQIEGLTKGQISYCLLYVSYTVSRTLDEHPLDSDEVLTLLDAILRAVELGRFRSVAPKFEITSKDYSWLVFLENRIEETYTKVAPIWLESEGNVTDMYKSALYEKGLQFYGDNLPVSLISLLLAVGKKTKLMIKLCTDTICHSLHPLKLLTIPDNSYGYRSENNKDSLVKKWTNLITFVLNFCTTNASVKHNMILTRILKHLVQVDDCDYMMAAYSVLRGFQSSLVEKEHMVLLVKVVLQGVEHSVGGTWTNFYTTSPGTWDTLTKLGKQLDMEFPRLILPVWLELCKFYNSSQLKGIIEVMKDSIKKEAMLPAEMTNMLLKYFESKFRHDEECCDLMHFFKITDKGYQQALKKIAANFENYTPKALLLIAKRQHEETPTSKVTADNVLQKDVFNLIRLALSRLQVLNKDYPTRYSYLDTGTLNYLKYFFEKLSEKDREEVASGKQFQNFMTHLSDSMKGDAEVLVTFLRSLEKTEHMLPKAKEKLGIKLIESFQRQFDYELRHCNHTSYHRVLGEMTKARQTCIQFVGNGAMLFRTAVTNYVSLKHKGKKKFIKLMDEYFKELNVD